jgi:cytochrome c peroxidase
MEVDMNKAQNYASKWMAPLLVITLVSCGGASEDDVSLSSQNINSQKDRESAVVLAASAPPKVSALPGARSMVAAESNAGISSSSGGEYFFNSSGIAHTFSTTGFIDRSNAFFKPFGNGRSCETCHKMAEGWSVTPARLKLRFLLTGGSDPIFNVIDAANSPNAPVSTLMQKAASYSLLLNKGLIRTGLPIPATAEFNLIKVDDPYGFASAAELSLFRRPLSSANLPFLSAVMWDGRETARDATSTTCIRNTSICFASIDFDLRNQANTAVKGHAQAAAGLTADEQRSIVDFENSIFSAQILDYGASVLTADGGKGGPLELSTTDFYFGINDLQTGDYKTNAPFNENVMTLYQGWSDYLIPGRARSRKDMARAAIVRGQNLFNNKVIDVVATKGINDAFNTPLFKGTCSSCHNVPNSGNRSVPLPIDIGTSDASRRTPDLPLYALQHKLTGEIIESTDPGRGLVTGKWADINKFKIPSLRGLASRAPYFHNGSAKTIEDTVTFYNTRFGMGLTRQEAADLAAFMKAL